MTAFALDAAIALLARTPRVLDAWLRGLEPCWTDAGDGEGSWSPFDVVGHLIHGERTDWIPRLRMILAHGEAQAFPPFDREAMFATSRGRSLDVLLDEFASLREQNLRALRDARLLPSDLTRRGRHPQFGPVTLHQLLATWVVHDLGHLRQIARTMAAQYSADVGPWRAYLSILDDAEAARAPALRRNSACPRCRVPLRAQNHAASDGRGLRHRVYRDIWRSRRAAGNSAPCASRNSAPKPARRSSSSSLAAARSASMACTMRSARSASR